MEKTIEQLRNEYAVNIGFNDWEDLLFYRCMEHEDAELNEDIQATDHLIQNELKIKIAEIVYQNYNGGYECKQAIINIENLK